MQSSLHAFSWQEEHHKSIPYIITTFLLRGIGLAAEWIHLSLAAGQGSLVAVVNLALWAPLEDRVDFRMVCWPCTLLLSSRGWRGQKRKLGSYPDISLQHKGAVGECMNNLRHRQTMLSKPQGQWINLVWTSCLHVSFFSTSCLWRAYEWVHSLKPLLSDRQSQDPGLSFQFLTCHLQTVHYKISNNTWL